MSRPLTRLEVHAWAQAILFGENKSYSIKELQALKEEALRVGYDGYAEMCDHQLSYIQSKFYLDTVRAEKIDKLKDAGIIPNETQLLYKAEGQEENVIFLRYAKEYRLVVQSTTKPRNVFRVDPLYIGLPGTDIVPMDSEA